MRSLLAPLLCVFLLFPSFLQAEVEGGEAEPDTELKDDRSRGDKATAGLLIGLLTGLGAGVVDVALSRVIYQSVEPEPGGAFEAVLIASPYVAFSVGSAAGAAIGVNRAGDNMGHGSRLGVTLLGAGLGAATLGFGLGSATGVISEKRRTDSEPVDSFGAAAMGLMTGAIIGGAIGGLACYEILDPSRSDGLTSLKATPILFASDGKSKVPGLMISAHF